MTNASNCPPGPQLLVYTSCCSCECKPGPALMVYTLCPSDKCRPGPAILVYTGTAPRGPGSPLKFELDLP